MGDLMDLARDFAGLNARLENLAVSIAEHSRREESTLSKLCSDMEEQHEQICEINATLRAIRMVGTVICGIGAALLGISTFISQMLPLVK